jgi:malonyl CoA-acyl carrier protein transacylase
MDYLAILRLIGEIATALAQILDSRSPMGEAGGIAEQQLKRALDELAEVKKNDI